MPSCRRALPVSQSPVPGSLPHLPSREIPRSSRDPRPSVSARGQGEENRHRDPHRCGVCSQGLAQGVAHLLPREGPLAGHVEDFARGDLGLARCQKGRHQILNVAKAESPRRTGGHWQKTSCHPPDDLQGAPVSGTVHDGGTQHGDVQAIPYTENGRLTLQLAPPVGETGRGETSSAHAVAIGMGPTAPRLLKWTKRRGPLGVSRHAWTRCRVPSPLTRKNSRATWARVNPATW
jgi:hypothetical protein